MVLRLFLQQEKIHGKMGSVKIPRSFVPSINPVVRRSFNHHGSKVSADVSAGPGWKVVLSLVLQLDGILWNKGLTETLHSRPCQAARLRWRATNF